MPLRITGTVQLFSLQNCTVTRWEGVGMGVGMGVVGRGCEVTGAWQSLQVCQRLGQHLKALRQCQDVSGAALPL